MGRKKRDKSDPSGGKQVNFRTPDALYARLEAVAEALGLDIANLVRLIINENLKSYEQRAEQARLGS